MCQIAKGYLKCQPSGFIEEKVSNILLFQKAGIVLVLRQMC